MGGFDYHIDKQIKILSEQEAMNAVYTKELNLISYKGSEPRYDIRKWKHEEDKVSMMKGITLTAGEAAALAAALNEELIPQNR